MCALKCVSLAEMVLAPPVTQVAERHGATEPPHREVMSPQAMAQQYETLRRTLSSSNVTGNLSSNPNNSVGTVCPDYVATNRHPCQGGYV